MMERWFTVAFRAPGNADFAGCADMLLRTPVAGYRGCCPALRDADYTESPASWACRHWAS